MVKDNDVNYGTFWLDVEPLDGVWEGESQNIEYIAALGEEAKNLGMSVGVYTTIDCWQGVVGSETSASLAKLPLWYAHYDNDPSYEDSAYFEFNGWTKPAMKQYNGGSTLCDVEVDLDWTGDMSDNEKSSNTKPNSSGKGKESN